MSKLEDNKSFAESGIYTALCSPHQAASSVHNMGWRRSGASASVFKTHSLFGENGMRRENISPQNNMSDERENRKVTFDFGYFYTCAFCTKVLKERSELEEHLEDDHDDEDVDESFLDGPMFKVRKIKYYLDQVCKFFGEVLEYYSIFFQMRDLNVNTESFSIIDLIQDPVQELSDIFESLTDEQKKLCW